MKHRSRISFPASVKIRVNQWPNSLGALAAGLLILFFCVILLSHDPLIFWNDDYELSVLPVFADVARSWAEGYWPILSPYSWVCGNLAGEFQYGTFSVFVNAAVVLIWKFPLTFPQQAAALSITHLFVLAIGAFLLARDRRFSIPFSIFPMLFGVALGFGLSAPAWLAILDLVHGSARELQPASAHWQWLVPPAALPGLILPSWTVNWTDFSSRNLTHAATELACGLAAPAALIAGFVWHGRMLVRRMKWELILLLIVLLLSMIPTAGLFRWSFRWLPFFHLVLAICAADALQMKPQPTTAATASLALVVVTAIAMSIFRTGGAYTFPLTWILLALAGIWAVAEFVFGRDAALRRPGHRSAMTLPVDWLLPCVTFLALLATYLCIAPNGGVPKYNFSQELLKPSPLDPQRLYLSIYPWAELNYRVEKKPQPVGQIVRPGSTSMWAGLHFINGYSPIRPAGVAREFAATIHGEINPAVDE